MKTEQLVGFRYTKAIVAFGGEATLWWMRFLKKGFYHCIVALGYKNEWVIIDPLIHFTDIIVVKKGNVESFLHQHGYRTLKVDVKEPSTRRLRVMPYTCVETAKRFIGVVNPFILTPYGLFCYLNEKIGKKSLTLI